MINGNDANAVLINNLPDPVAVEFTVEPAMPAVIHAKLPDGHPYCGALILNITGVRYAGPDAKSPVIVDASYGLVDMDTSALVTENARYKSMLVEIKTYAQSEEAVADAAASLKRIATAVPV